MTLIDILLSERIQKQMYLPHESVFVAVKDRRKGPKLTIGRNLVISGGERVLNEASPHPAADSQ